MATLPKSTMRAIYTLAAPIALGLLWAGVGVQGLRRRWPLRERTPLPALDHPAAWFASALAAGAGTGAFTGLLHPLTAGGVHVATLAAMIFMAAALVVVIVKTPALRALGASALFLLGNEAGAQLGYHRGLGWWDDITGFDAAAFAVALVAIAAVAGVRRARVSRDERPIGG